MQRRQLAFYRAIGSLASMTLACSLLCLAEVTDPVVAIAVLLVSGALGLGIGNCLAATSGEVASLE